MSKALSLLLMAILTACAAVDPGSGPTTTTNRGGASTTSEAGGPTLTTDEPPGRLGNKLGPVPEWFVDENAAPEDLVAVIADQLDAEYAGSMGVEFNNSGMGCTDGITLQVITPGWVIMFDTPDGFIRVHAADNGRWVQCDPSRPLQGTPILSS